MTSEIFYLTQVSIVLLSVFLDNGSIDSSSQYIEKLAFLTFLKMRALFYRLT